MVKRIALFGFHKISQIYRTSLFILKIGLNIIFQFSFQVTRKITGLCYNSTLETCKPVVSSIIRCIIRPDIFVLILLKCRSWNYISRSRYTVALNSSSFGRFRNIPCSSRSNTRAATNVEISVYGISIFAAPTDRYL